MSTTAHDDPAYTHAATITPHDSTNFNPCKAIYVGGAGTVPVVFEGGVVVTFTAVAGAILPLRAKRVNTGGSATGLIALY
jgi:hypothetical protein